LPLKTGERHYRQATLRGEEITQKSPCNCKSNPLDSCSGVDLDGGTVGEVCGVRRPVEYAGQIRSVECGGVAFETRFGHGPHTPRRMDHLVFESAARLLAGISPIVFGDVLFETIFGGELR